MKYISLTYHTYKVNVCSGYIHNFEGFVKILFTQSLSIVGE